MQRITYFYVVLLLIAPLPDSGPRFAAAEKIGDAWSDPRNPVHVAFDGERLDLWSLKPRLSPKTPRVESSWPRGSIDRFILDRLAAAKLEPSAEADRRALIRRVTFDLTGLPPEPESVARFVADANPDAYERLIDELLSSPHYGAHMTRTWLDVVRYSDSNGFDWDEFRPQIWRYRDYVIRSFNADKPYDEFVREQLAGDELVDGAPRDEADRDRLLATGFLRLGPQDNSVSLFNEQARARAEWMADLVDTTGSALLGLTFACCRCHDHKHDPLLQADYYRLRAFFEPLRYGDDVPLDLADDHVQIELHNARLDERQKQLATERDELRKTALSRLIEQRRAALSNEERTRLDKLELADLKKHLKIKDEDVASVLEVEGKRRDDEIAQELKHLQADRRQALRGLLATDSPEVPPVTRILMQGDYREEQDIVPAGFISVLDPNAAAIERGKNSKTHGRRLTLANWIVSSSNPLTARVLVNRVWQMHFGRGLVETPNDFGLAGARPSHPELLDWLAEEFIRSGWSIKQLHRTIVTSATYQQAARAPDAADAENVLYSRQNLRRLTAEQLRDALLAVSGSLTTKADGPPVWQELPAEILQANPAFLDDNAEKNKSWYPSPEAEQGARSIFLVQKRGVQIPLLEIFDSPAHSVSCARRTTSIVAPQALALLNSDLAVKAARSLAERVQTSSDPDGRVDRLYWLALQRTPSDSERKRCRNFLANRSLPELCRVILNLNEFAYLD